MAKCLLKLSAVSKVPYLVPHLFVGYSLLPPCCQLALLDGVYRAIPMDWNYFWPLHWLCKRVTHYATPSVQGPGVKSISWSIKFDAFTEQKGIAASDSPDSPSLLFIFSFPIIHTPQCSPFLPPASTVICNQLRCEAHHITALCHFLPFLSH